MTPATLLATPLLPDVEQVLSQWLRAQRELERLVHGRVFTAFPRQKGSEPMIIVRRFGGQPPIERPLVLDQALVQADIYGGTKTQAWEVTATLRAVVSERCNGTGSTPTVYVRACRYLPDESYPSPRPRYICDLEAFIRPWAAPTAAPKSWAAPATDRPRAALAVRKESPS